MILDDLQTMKKIDAQDMLGAIDRLPDQLEEAWQAGQSFPLPDSYKKVRRVLITGMGGSAIGGSLLSAYVAPLSGASVTVWRDYSLPAWAKGPETLVIASSYSGNTEETLSAYQSARENKCALLAMTTGGKLAAEAEKDGVPLWKFSYRGQPRSAVGYTFALPCAAAVRLGLIPDPAADVAAAAAAMRNQQKSIAAGMPSAENPAKQLAAKWPGKSVIVFGADYLAPVARRWKGQVSEVAKAWSQFEELPELDHNTVAGTVQPGEVIERSFAVFLRSTCNHPRNVRRIEITRGLFARQGWQTEVIEGSGGGPLSQMYTCLHFGDYAALYLAFLYNTDPSPVAVIEDLKKMLLTPP
ncbi:MAG: bifunctional phosphoglucose/phosphomannose isomerase [Anaerolineales bacterium]|nr:bifunctional phosphoglucose/phosphomannose isomerase [Anaerolineales bacterium]